MKTRMALLRAALTAISVGVLAAPAWADAPVCAMCGKEIGPGRYVQDQWRANFHLQHQSAPRCYYCARAISPFNTGGGVRYPGGREVCNICHHTAVVDPNQAAAALARVRQRMSSWGLQFDYGEIPVRLVDQATLNAMFGRGSASHDGNINGLTTKRWTKDDKGRVLAREVTISMLYGLPLEVYEKTMAHELMHAWMFLDSQPEHEPVLEEGVCNLAAYYVLQENPSDLANFTREAMWRSKDPVYGQGLRRAIAFVKRHEFSGLVKMLRERKGFPAGF
ncbi:MAG: protein DA1 [Candidatus Sericytochromatia bacterium]|nr:protein DA1 [Candidatus Sericytochromatia bacterium]